MLGGAGELPEDAVGDIAYLARSNNRVEILMTLATAPHTPRSLAEVTEASRSTLERILTELDERGWAERTADGAYTVTPVGELTVAEFTPLVGAMQAIRTLDDAVDWLPREELSIGLHHFRDATVIRPEPNGPMAPDTRLIDLLCEADEFRCLVRIAPSLVFEKAMRDGVVEGRLRTEHVITDGELAYISDQPGRLERWREYLKAGANLFRYDGHIPCNLFVMDEAVLIADRQPETCAFIESENEMVRS